MLTDFDFLSAGDRVTIAGAPDGVDTLALAGMAAAHPAGVLHVCHDDRDLARKQDTLGFFQPNIEVLVFPAWDCLPYDRVSPQSQIISARIGTLTRLASGAPAAGSESGRIVLTTVSAALQRVPPQAMFKASAFAARPGQKIDLEALAAFLADNGYTRTGTVREPGEYAFRGGIIDLFPPGSGEPMRLDLFGDEVETIRTFDPLTQRTTGTADEIVINPVNEVLLDDDAIARFRTGYRSVAGGAAKDDSLYEAISAGRRFAGMEHWLPFFHDGLATLFDYLPDAAITTGHQTGAAVEARVELIADYHQARKAMAEAGGDGDLSPHYPAPPELMFLSKDDWENLVSERPGAQFTPFDLPEEMAAMRDAGGKAGIDLADARALADTNLFDALGAAISAQHTASRRVLIAAYSDGSRDRLQRLAAEHGVEQITAIDDYESFQQLAPGEAGITVLGIETGFIADGLSVITEQAVLGDRLVRRPKRKRPENFLQELSALNEDDFVVHVDHGIGRYRALETLDVGRAPHDCLRVEYAGGDSLFVPVENIEVLSRFGSEDSAVELDRLGSASWQARRARVKERIREIADKLLGIAAERELKTGDKIAPPEGLYEEFAARFPYSETDDQRRAIDDTLADMVSGKPMDRLICGDVGFGKTEIALRAAFIAAMHGGQVAVVVPTTLLARQHDQTFRERMAGLPIEIRQLSRLVPAREQIETREALESGHVDIVIGTHALLGDSIKFKNLSLLVVDEEQHFGVVQKERLKQIRSDVHVLTLTATPIPRTLQMALAGVRDMSIIATPPVDRLAIRTFVLPYDPVVIKEAIDRERFRGGQIFYVCPRIEDIARVKDRLSRLVPDLKVAVATGQMAPADLEATIAAFYDGQYECLLSTNIIESGLDIPTANTMIVHRSEMFGLSQLYQLRGRIGRSKIRAYAYLTLPPDRIISKAAEKRLTVMQTLDSLGAGFSLASHDLDIRGAGNLLGDEQSGHIREVGVELYQQMLEDAVATAKEMARSVGALPDGGEAAQHAQHEWSPQITLGMPVLIPETYVEDLSVRLGLYRRLSQLVDTGEIDAFAAELVDRFGTLPEEVENLIRIVKIKRYALQSGIEKIDAGPKGAVLSFRNDSFANPEGLVRFISEQAGTVKLRPDHKLVYRRQWDKPESRVKGVDYLLRQIANVATAA